MKNLRHRLLLPALLAAPILSLAAPSEPIWLSSLDLTPIVQGWGKPQADKAVTGKPLSIAGRKFEHGLGTHANSLVRLELKGGTEKFSALVGVDDAAGNGQASICTQFARVMRLPFEMCDLRGPTTCR